MEKLVSKIAAFGVPWLVLLVAVSTAGSAGGAAIIAALSALGPGGIVGGIATLGMIGLITQGIAEFGMEAIFCAVVKELVKNGESKESIAKYFKTEYLCSGEKTDLCIRVAEKEQKLL